MYKILIKYTSKLNKIYWRFYEKLEDGTNIEFSTDSIDVLESEIQKIASKFGYDDIKIVKDFTYNILVDISEIIDLDEAEIATSEDVSNVFDTAFSKVFGGGV